MRKHLLIAVCLFTLSGCAPSVQKNQQLSAISQNELDSSDDDIFNEFEEELSQKQVTIADPIEPVNKLMFNVNDAIYFWVAKPVIHIYTGIVPKPGRIGINNFFYNLGTPVRLVNCLLQGKCSAAGKELNRFAINTSVGILGITDPAKDKWGLEPAEEDLGQTLAVWGFGDGIYIVWPFLGPSTCRDSVGMVGDAFLNPVRYVKPTEVSIGISAVDVVNDGSFHIGDYESFKAASIDPYIAMRDAYIQYRSQKVKE